MGVGVCLDVGVGLVWVCVVCVREGCELVDVSVCVCGCVSVWV